MLPSVFGENLFDDFFDRSFLDLPGWSSRGLMKTDVRETGDGYELDVDLPGFQKDDIRVELKNGYLTISAVQHQDRDQKDNQGRYVRRERYSGSCSRSFYVGDVEQKDVSAKYEDGILKLTVPKTVKQALPEQSTIAID